MTFWQTPSFKQLQETWYQRLAAEGFQDQEVMVGEELVLRQYARGTFRNVDTTKAVELESYYRTLSARVQESAFRNDTERIILTMIASGAKIKKIVEELERIGHARCRFTIRCIVRKYERAWGLRAPEKKAKTA